MPKLPRKPAAAPPVRANVSSTRARSLIIGIVIVAAVAVAAFAFVQSDRAESSAGSAPAGGPAPSVPATTLAQATEPAVVLAAHPQKEFPPLQLPTYPLGRSAESITAAYKFAAEHPEILTYVPCFCGCERGGHRGNEDCFVKTRAPNGDVTEWEPHGMECNVCLDVATQAMQMYSSGASVRDIRSAVEKKWASQAAQMHTHTPTPDPPK